MPATITDRIDGLTTSVAVKAPVRVATTANITLSGIQTLDGVLLSEGDDNTLPDRVLVKDQDDPTENGIREVSSGAWRRTRDFDGNRDVVQGTQVPVYEGTVNGRTVWQCTTPNRVVIGTSSIVFEQIIDTDIADDLSDGTNAALGAALVTYNQSLAYTAGSVGARLLRQLSAKDAPFNCVGDGVTNDTAGMQAFLTACAGKSGYIPPGTYIVSALNGVSNCEIFGAGEDVTILKRKSNASGNSAVLDFTGKTNFHVSDLTVDGNKANQSSAAHNISIATGSYNWKLENIRSINAKAVTGAYGAGVAVVDGANDTNGVSSRIIHCDIANNDTLGIYVNKEWYITIFDNVIRANGTDGIQLLNYVFPPVSEVQDYISITKNRCLSNGGNGITVSGYVVGGSSSATIYGPTVPQCNYCDVSENTCAFNDAYGVVFQGAMGACNGNIVHSNGYGAALGAGILFNAVASSCCDNKLNDNASFQIDAGGAYYSVVSNNVMRDGGVTNNSYVTHLNVGAAVGSTIESNIVVMGGTAQNTGILFSGIDGDGATPFPVVGAYNSIKDNRVFCNANSNSVGIQTNRMAVNAEVSGNFVFNVNAINNAYLLQTESGIYRENILTHSSMSGSLILSIASASTVVIPDAGETFYITGSTGITNIKTYSNDLYYQKVRDVLMTNQGSGYTPGSHFAVTFSGGGGAGATATAEVDNGGRVIGVTMTNNGSGYTSTPTADFSAGGGTGAAGTPQVGCNNLEGREIDLIFQGGLTVTDGGNLGLVGNFVTTANKSILKLKGYLGAWIEVSRATS